MLEDILDKMSFYPQAWWVAGGWAIDLHLGQQHRQHKDIDLAVLRRDKSALQSCLSGWSLQKIVGGQSESWHPDEMLELPIHEVHATRNEEHLEFLLNEADGDTWLFRRNPEISMPVRRLARISSTGIPYLCPEVVLLYKAKAPRVHDEDDFNRIRSVLNAEAKQWLVAALNVCHPGHQWTDDLLKEGGADNTSQSPCEEASG